jgi:hypothetical protein
MRGRVNTVKAFIVGFAIAWGFTSLGIWWAEYWQAQHEAERRRPLYAGLGRKEE